MGGEGQAKIIAISRFIFGEGEISLFMSQAYFKAYFNLWRTVNPIGLSSPPNFLENYCFRFRDS